MNLWESRLVYPDGVKANYKQVRNGRYFTLTAKKTTHEILPGLIIEGLSFDGVIPAPLIVLNQGEWVYINLKNELDEPVSLHVHGLSKPNSEDGIPEIEPTPKIEPGTSYTYQFQAWQAGTFFYHSGNPKHISLGMLGGFVVLPQINDMSKIPYRDYVLLLQQWEIDQPEVGKVYYGTYKPKEFDQHANFFTINGKSFPNTSALKTKYGENIRIRFINKSSNSHSMHIHGHDFKVTEIDGFKRSDWQDTINVPSGQRISVEFVSLNQGIWPINGTKTFHQTNNGETPGGMITKLEYKNSISKINKA